MAEIKISFDLRFSRRFITASAAVAMMLCAVPELNSESVTLSTYYPAPSGVYVQMITTNNTFLARDGGNVALGATVSAAKLHINGNMLLSGANPLIDFIGAGSGVYAPGGTGLTFDTSGMERVRLNNAGYLGIGINAPFASLDVNGNIVARTWDLTFTLQ